jgi:hypothetical protein
LIGACDATRWLAVKNTISSKAVLIRQETELIERFRNLLSEDPDLEWRLHPSPGPRQPDKLEMQFDGHQVKYHAAYELKPSRARLAILKMTHPAPLLLVTPELSPRLIEFCKAQGIAAMDLNGRAWLRGPGLMVDRGPRPGRGFHYELEPRNFFEGKSARILRCLLTDRDRLWTQGEIVARTRVSGGLASRIVQHLISHGYLDKAGSREFRIGDPLDLLDAWAGGDRPDRLANPSRFCTDLAPMEIARRLHDLYSRKPHPDGRSATPIMVGSALEAVQRSLIPFKGAFPPLLFTQGIAATLRCPHAPPALATSAYVSYLPTQGQLDTLELRPVTEGGNVWLFLPRDEGIFLESQTAQDLPLTTDAQMYLDLQAAGVGGDDATAALRSWNGFFRT